MDRFRREIRALIHQMKFINDPAIESFLKAEMASGSGPLSQFVSSLCLRAQQRSDSMVESSVIVGAKSFVFGNKTSKIDEEESGCMPVFSSSWLPEKKSQYDICCRQVVAQVTMFDADACISSAGIVSRRLTGPSTVRRGQVDI